MSFVNREWVNFQTTPTAADVMTGNFVRANASVVHRVTERLEYEAVALRRHSSPTAIRMVSFPPGAFNSSEWSLIQANLNQQGISVEVRVQVDGILEVGLDISPGVRENRYGRVTLSKPDVADVEKILGLSQDNWDTISAEEIVGAVFALIQNKYLQRITSNNLCQEISEP